jgi:tRNA/tmRNA/rRNA uracil-C5-methylase (TrmA/RlmC/RlmD family)
MLPSHSQDLIDTNKTKVLEISSQPILSMNDRIFATTKKDKKEKKRKENKMRTVVFFTSIRAYLPYIF